MLMLRITICLIGFSVACGVTSLQGEKDSTPVVSPEKVSIASPSPSTSICDKITEIRAMPFYKEEKGVDAAYDSIIEASETALPCLIERVSDTHPIHDPRPSPKYSDTRVGDVAYFLFVDITGIEFTELLPADVKRAFKHEGVYAYFRFVEEPANRTKLQGKLSEWYQKKYRSSHRKL